jgi:hypothetical protein
MTRLNLHSHFISCLAAVAAVAILLAGDAHAIDCSSSITLLGNSTLANDYTTSSATNPCFIAPSGYDLDFHAHTVTCTTEAAARKQSGRRRPPLR